MTVTLQSIRDNLINTIDGKRAFLSSLYEAREGGYANSNEIYTATQYLEINIDELEAILDDVEVVLKDTNKKESDRSWIDNPDRQGGAFTQDEINDTGWK